MLILDLYPNGALRAHKFPPNAVKDGRLAAAWEMLEFLLDEVLTPQRENAASLRPASISFTNRNIARALADPVRFLVCEQVTQDLHALVSRAGSAAAEADCWSPPVLAEADGVREFMQRFAQNLIAKGKGASSTASEAPGLIQGLLAGGERRDGRQDNRYILQALPLSKCELLVGQYYCWSPPVLAEADGVREFMQRFAQNLIEHGKRGTWSDTGLARRRRTARRPPG
jgi:hypothetical protein